MKDMHPGEKKHPGKQRHRNPDKGTRLSASHLLVLAAAFLALSATGAGCAEHRIEQDMALMGTDFSITVVDSDGLMAREAIKAAYFDISNIEKLMSIYDSNTEVSRLNSHGSLEDPDPILVNTLEQSRRYSELSGGAFDITVQPLLELYSKSFREQGAPPADEELETALELVGYDKVLVDKDRILLEPGMKITLGGIAKGLAVDRTGSVLRIYGIENALINAGGDVLALGTREDNMPWTLALENPRKKGDYITVLGISGMAVATSGDYERYFDESMTAHHIMDPRTGRSAAGLISATIIAPSAMEADALATSVFVMGKEDGLALVESLEDVEALVITEKREIVRSSGFARYEAAQA